MTDTSIKYSLLKTLENQPVISQRELSRQLNVSLGKINFCLNALVEKGCLKVNNFRKSDNKIAYAYLITPKGLEQKAKLTAEFLQIKIKEYEIISKELEELRRDLSKLILKR